VPGFAVQHLVENAIRHGIARRTGAGRLRITVRRDGDSLEIAVEDDGAGFDGDLPDRPGHGLDQTRERLRALHGDRASVTVTHGATGGARAILRVPYRTLTTDSGHA
jgi:LytS/YehU family sensor histidine kinase